MVKKLSLLFFSIVFGTVTYGAVVATVDRSDIALNESFNLRYESSDDEKRTPDFSPINKDFDIVGQNRETSLSIVNGKSSQKTIFNLSLMPKRLGTLTIPEIQFTNSVSASIIVNVKKQVTQNNNKDISLTVSVDKKQAYIQEQILLTVKLARAVNAQQESISDLEFSHEDIIIEALSDEYKQYEAMLNGRRHIVYERQYAVFPQKAGSLTLAPVSYGAVIPNQSSQRRRGFFDDPFFNRGTGKRVREQSNKITFTIKTKPDEFIGKHWLPANKVEAAVTFSDNVSKLQVGDSVTRTITIKADQQLASTLPAIKTEDITNAKIYPDQADTKQQIAKYGIYSQRVERAAIVPTQAGNITFPATQVEWWNTRKNKKEVINIPAEIIKVSGSTTDNINNVNGVATNTLSNNQSEQTSSKWFYIAIFALLAWLITLGSWLYLAWFKDKLSNKKVSGDKAAILAACKNNNAVAAKEALIAWAKQQWPEKNINNLGSLSNVANSKELTAALNNLQNNLYGQSAEKWNKQLLIKAINNIQSAPQSSSKDKHILFNIH